MCKSVRGDSLVQTWFLTRSSMWGAKESPGTGYNAGKENISNSWAFTPINWSRRHYAN